MDAWLTFVRETSDAVGQACGDCEPPRCGHRQVEWWNTWTGKPVEVEYTVTRDGGDPIIEAPGAFKLIPIESD